MYAVEPPFASDHLGIQMDGMGRQSPSLAVTMENHYWFDVVLASHYLLADCEVVGSASSLYPEITMSVVQDADVKLENVVVVVHDDVFVAIVDGHYEAENLMAAILFVDALVNPK